MHPIKIFNDFKSIFKVKTKRRIFLINSILILIIGNMKKNTAENGKVIKDLSKEDNTKTLEK